MFYTIASFKFDYTCMLVMIIIFSFHMYYCVPFVQWYNTAKPSNTSGADPKFGKGGTFGDKQQ